MQPFEAIIFRFLLPATSFSCLILENILTRLHDNVTFAPIKLKDFSKDAVTSETEQQSLSLRTAKTQIDTHQCQFFSFFAAVSQRLLCLDEPSKKWMIGHRLVFSTPLDDQKYNENIISPQHLNTMTGR